PGSSIGRPSSLAGSRGLSLRASSKAGRSGASDLGQSRKRSGVVSGSGIQLIYRLRRVVKRVLRQPGTSYRPNGGNFAPALVGRDETNADHGAAARTTERRERRLGLAEGWNESETVRFRHASLALRTS